MRAVSVVSDTISDNRSHRIQPEEPIRDFTRVNYC